MAVAIYAPQREAFSASSFTLPGTVQPRTESYSMYLDIVKNGKNFLQFEQKPGFFNPMHQRTDFHPPYELLHVLKAFYTPRPSSIEIEKNDYLQFKQKITVKQSNIEDGYVLLEYKHLNIYATGESLSEAKESFWEDVMFLWASYAHAEDETLTEDARELKAKLLECLMEV